MSLKEKMTALADAVRSKANRSDTLTIDAMTEAVKSLSVGNPSTQTLTVTPNKNSQTFSSSALGENTYYSTVTVNPIPSEYITTNDATAASGDILSGKTAYVKGQKVTGSMTNHGTYRVKVKFNTESMNIDAPGFYSGIAIEVEKPTVKTLTVTPTEKKQTFTANDGNIENGQEYYGSVTVEPIPSEYIVTTGATATENTILEGETAYVDGEKVTGKYIPVEEKFVAYGVGYGANGFLGKQVGTFTADATAEAEDIAPGKTAYVFGAKVTGAMPAKTAETYTPGTENITIPAGTYLSGAQTIRGDEALVSENIKAGASIFGVQGSYTSDATAAASDIASGKTAYVKGQKVIGTASGGETFYKCTAVLGPQIISYVSVTNAGITDCNGNYSDSGLAKNGQPIYSYASTSGTTWYIYYITSEWEGDSWVLSDNLDVTTGWYAHYYGSSLSGNWWGGENAGEEAGQAAVSLEYNAINTDQPKTWEGRQFLTTEEGYELSDELTTGLTYAVGSTGAYVNDCIMPEVGGIYNSNCTAKITDVKVKTDDALTFTAEEPFSTVWFGGNNMSQLDFSGVRYSTDGKVWKTYNHETITLDKVGSFVKFINSNSTFSSDPERYYSSVRFALTGKISASGELKSLLNYSENWPRNCFNGLFRNQNALTSAPYVSCNTLGANALDHAFNGCKNLKKIKVDITSHIKNPDNDEYRGVEGMLGGCTSLILIEVDFTSWEGLDTSIGWVGGVSAKGVFVKPAALPEEYGEKRIPEGWQVVNK